MLINNAGTAGRDLSGARDLDNWREVFNHCYNVNATGAAILTETMLPLLHKSKLPKIIFISSALGSIANVLRPEAKLLPVPFYSASKTAVNYLAAYYAKKCPHFKVNSCCPRLNATKVEQC